MVVSLNKRFPPDDGWIRMDATLKSNIPLSEDSIKRLVTFGKQDSYEFGIIEQYGKKLKVVLREIK